MMSAKEATATALDHLYAELVKHLPLSVANAVGKGLFSTSVLMSSLVSKDVLQSILGEGYAIALDQMPGSTAVVAEISWLPTQAEATAMLMSTPLLEPVQQLSVDATNIEARGFLARIRTAAEKGKWEYSEVLNKALTVDVLQKRLGSAYKVSRVKDYVDGTHLVHVSWHLTPEQAEAHLMPK
jgi:hypothetical protein